MLGFCVKKAFFDLWDNFLPAVLLNLGFVAVLAVPIILPTIAAAAGTIAGIAVLVAGILLSFLYLGLSHSLARDITDYDSLDLRNIGRATRESLRHALLLGLIVVLHVVLISIALPVYAAMESVFGLFAIAVLFWISVIWLLTAQFYLPLADRLSKPPFEALKKAFLLLLDNTGFAIVVALGSILIIAGSFLTAFLFPGIAGLAIWMHTAVKLRLYKYDYLEAHPDTPRSEVPWDELLFEDRERVGKRTVRGMIFPWKE